MCRSSCDNCIDPVPTLSPTTLQPTKSSAPSISSIPTFAPTKNPTKSPSYSPSSEPTNTRSPTSSPMPTHPPSMSPTERCKDDLTAKFYTNAGTMKNCRWLAEKGDRISRYCTIREPRSICKLTCGDC